MAKRTYNRDARGRFASGGGSGGKGGGKSKAPATPKPASTGRGGPRGGKVGTKAEQAKAKKAQAQRQATFASKSTAGREAKARVKQARSQARSQARAAGRGKATSGIRRTGGLQTVKPASNIRPTTGPRRAPIGGARNAIRTFNPKTPRGQVGQMNRQIDKIGKEVKATNKKLKEATDKLAQAKRRFDRSTARDIADAKKPGLVGEYSRIMLSAASGSMLRGGQNVIRQRAARARVAANRGSAAGKRALEIYGNQLAFTGAGKPSRGAKNKIVPGPRSTQPPAKPKRKPKPKPPGKPKPPSKPRKPRK